MEQKNLRVIYSNLMAQWQTECNWQELRKLSDDEFETYLKFQKQIHDLEHEAPPKDVDDTTRKIIWELKLNSGKIIDFLINDLLDLRQEKIIRMCRDLEIIDESLLTSTEYEFYKNVMSAFKGYRKMRNAYSVIADACQIEPEIEESAAFCQVEGYSDNISSTKVEYSLMRVLKEIESIVGFDSCIYGPFKKEDIALIPKINAKILEKEKLIELID